MPLSRLKPKSDSAVVRNMLAEIEAALSAGVAREAIWKTLCEEQGLSISFDGFAKALFRARKSKGQRVPITGQNPATATPQVQAPGVDSTVQPAPPPPTPEPAPSPAGVFEVRDALKEAQKVASQTDYSKFAKDKHRRTRK
jgi:hypothetical protein